MYKCDKCEKPTEPKLKNFKGNCRDDASLSTDEKHS